MLNYAFYEKKRCKYCGGYLQKWGKNASGSKRYRCSQCGLCDTRSRSDISRLNHQRIYDKWLLSKFTLSDFAHKYGVTRRTLDNWFKPFRNSEIVPKSVFVPDQALIVDGYYLEYGATVLIAQSANNQVVSWSFTHTENFSTWLIFFEQIKMFPFAVVCDGQRGMIKAIKLRWPGIVVQRCQFHVIHQVNILLTKRPELIPAQKFKRLVRQINLVKTREELKYWLYGYKQWYQEYGSFLKERTYQEACTPTGRRKWHYTHGRLHAAHSHLKNALPGIFQYIRFTTIPQTSNRIEGGINAQIQRRIDYHRGTTLFQRRQIIASLLKQKQA